MSQEKVLVLGAGTKDSLPLLQRLLLSWGLSSLDVETLNNNFVSCCLISDQEGDVFSPQLSTVTRSPENLISCSIEQIRKLDRIYIIALGDERKKIIDGLIALAARHKELLENKTIHFLQDGQNEQLTDHELRQLRDKLKEAMGDAGAVDFGPENKLKEQFETDIGKVAPAVLQSQSSSPKKSCCTARNFGIFAAGTAVTGLWIGLPTAAVLTGVVSLATVGIIAGSLAACALIVVLAKYGMYKYRQYQEKKKHFVPSTSSSYRRAAPSGKKDSSDLNKSSCTPRKVGMIATVATLSAGFWIGLPTAGVLTGVVSLSTVGMIMGPLAAAVMLSLLLVYLHRTSRPQKQARVVEYRFLQEQGL